MMPVLTYAQCHASRTANGETAELIEQIVEGSGGPVASGQPAGPARRTAAKRSVARGHRLSLTARGHRPADRRRCTAPARR